MKNTKIIVKTKSKTYPIYLGEKNLNTINGLIKKNLPRVKKICIIYDKNVPSKLLTELNKSLKKFKLRIYKLSASEKMKNLTVANNIIENLLKNNFNRSDCIISFGGGIISDLSAFISSLLKRGTKFINIPTTLLAQADAAIGGKTGINSRYGKNLIGTFNQPKSVIISIDLLKTLEKRELISGYAEILKYSFIKDKRFFSWLKTHGNKILSLERKSCIHAIKKSCLIKADIVSIDEKEEGIRELLNFGHTFGHAIESITGFSDKLRHGESIFLGMFLAIKFSIYLKFCHKDVLKNYICHLKDLNIFFKVQDYKLKISPKNFLKHIKFDKKIKNKQIKFILLKDIGKPVRFFLEDEKVLLNFLKNELK